MALTCLTYSPPVRRPTRPQRPDYALLDAALALAEEGKSVESVTKVFQHLLPTERIPDLATQTFSFTQGSSRVSVRVDGDELQVWVPVVRLPSGGSAIAALRFVLTEISGSGQLHQPRLHGDDLFLEFREKISSLHPAKVLEVLQRLPVEADLNDDWLIGEFAALPLERAPIDGLDTDEVNRSEALWRTHWSDVEELVKEAQRKRSMFLLNEVTAYARWRIAFALPLTGLLAARLSESAAVFDNDQVDPLKRQALLLDCAVEMKAISREELHRNLGHAKYAISPRQDGTPALLSNCFEAGSYIKTVDGLRETGKALDAALSLIRTYNQLLAAYAWPETVEAQLQDGLALASDKPWREAADALFNHAKAMVADYGGSLGHQGDGGGAT